MRTTADAKLRGMSEAALIDQLPFLSLNDPRLRLNFVVTEQDILLSEPGCPTKCAISTALRRAFPQSSWICTRHDKITVTIDGRYLHFAQTRKGSRTIQAFDELRLDKPTSLTIKLNDVGLVKKASNKRKEQINEARRKRVAEGRPDKRYNSPSMRTKTTKWAKAKAEAA